MTSISISFFAEGLKKISNSEDVRYDKVLSSDGKKIVKIIARSGSRRGRPEAVVIGGIEYQSAGVSAGIHTSSAQDYFEMILAGGNEFYLRWKETRQTQPLTWTGGGSTRFASLWELDRKFSFHLGVNGELEVPNTWVKDYRGVRDFEDVPPSHRQEVGSTCNHWMGACFLEAMTDFVTAVKEINVWTLNSMLFRDENAVTFKEVHYPADLALFGHIGPTSNNFTITPLEPVLGHTETFQFTTEPSRNDLKWDVHNILGETVPKGSINAMGLYTAPKAAEIEEDFVRVRVSATAGGVTRSALVTVMRRSITVNPIIRVATAGDPLALDVSAGTVAGDTLTWSIKDPSSGAVVRPNPGEGKDHSYLPGPVQNGKGYTIDEIVVTNPRTNETESAHVMVLHRMPLLTAVVDDRASLPDNKVQLVVMGQNGPVDPGVLDLTWDILLGNGSASIDSKSGVLTVDPAGPDKYVVIITTLPSSMPGVFPDSQGGIILPLPLFSISQTINMLCTDDQ